MECQRCCGNGEIVVDWDRFIMSEPGDRGDEGIAVCPDCDGFGSVDDESEEHHG